MILCLECMKWGNNDKIMFIFLFYQSARFVCRSKLLHVMYNIIKFLYNGLFHGFYEFCVEAVVYTNLVYFS